MERKGKGQPITKTDREDVLPDFMNKPKKEKLIYEVVDDEPIDRQSLIDQIKRGKK